MRGLPGSRIRWLATFALAAALPLAGWRALAHRHRSYLDVPLGCRPVEGVSESGFHFQEFNGPEPFRWTNGAAKLLVPIDGKRPPQRLWVSLETFRPGATAVRVQIRVSDTPVFDGPVPAGRWEKTLDLPPQVLSDPLLIELRSDAFVPRGKMDRGKNTDTRVLGVQVKGVRLQRDGR